MCWTNHRQFFAQLHHPWTSCCTASFLYQRWLALPLPCTFTTCLLPPTLSLLILTWVVTRYHIHSSLCRCASFANSRKPVPSWSELYLNMATALISLENLQLSQALHKDQGAGEALSEIG